MHCFNHQKSSAFCACGVCFKGLCNECMQPMDDKFVCSPVCAQQLQKITELNNYAISIYGIDKPEGQQKVGRQTAILHLAISLPFLGCGAYLGLEYNDIVLGSFMIIPGIILFFNGYKTYKRGLRL